MTTAENEIGVNTNLQKQDLSNLDISNLTPLSPEVISRQATINIGTIGHVAHGKSTVVKAISGVQTVRFKNELERNITIKLERISYEQLLKISQSAKLLREYEARENLRLKQLQYERKFNCSPSSSLDTNHTYHQHHQQHQQHHYNPQQQVDTFLSVVERGNSTSPSSGYESFDNASSYSGDESGSSRKSRIFRKKLSHTKQIFINAQKELDAAQTSNKREATTAALKRRASTSAAECGDDSQNAQKAKRRRHNPNSEYVVERIESLESVNGRPVFYVKWLNYPENQNTWESIHNLFECEALEQFVDKQYEFYDLAISTITAELEAEIERESLSFETSKLNLEELDSYEPLLLKADLILLAQFREANSRNQREPALIRKRVIEAMLIKPFYYLRKKQLNDLQKWQERMNEVEYQAPVSVENNVDLEVLDMSFQYIKESFPGEGVQISDQPPFGCKCVDACAPMSKCCARMADSYFAYEKNGRLRIRPGEAIYECNRTCACNEDCVNRVIQRGRNNALCLFKTSTGCGWGVRTERIMRKGEYVCEYVGEIIKTEEANERGKQYDAIGRTYLFDLDYNTAAESVYTIDAAMHGNISHFINHSCDPNLAVFPFWINNLDVNMPRLAFFTLRPIKAGEELTFDYIRTDSDGEDYNNLSKAEKVTCRCGAEKCRKVLF